jgi:hypothetical protein
MFDDDHSVRVALGAGPLGVDPPGRGETGLVLRGEDELS